MTKYESYGACLKCGFIGSKTDHIDKHLKWLKKQNDNAIPNAEKILKDAGIKLP